MAICKVCGGWCKKPGELCNACKRALKRLEGYVISRDVVDQIRWERDVAHKQLEEHGIPFCGKAPDVVKVVRCKDCKYRHKTVSGLKICQYHITMEAKDDDFCSYGERRNNENNS